MIYWKITGIHTPVFHSIIAEDVIAIACMFMLIIIFTVSLTRAFRHEGYAPIVLAILLVTTYHFDLLEGRMIFRRKNCDMSTYTDIKLYSNGKFVLYAEDQAESRFYKGHYTIRNSMIYLYRNQKPDRQNTGRASFLLTADGQVDFKAVDFQCAVY